MSPHIIAVSGVLFWRVLTMIEEQKHSTHGRIESLQHEPKYNSDTGRNSLRPRVFFPNLLPNLVGRLLEAGKGKSGFLNLYLSLERGGVPLLFSRLGGEQANL